MSVGAPPRWVLDTNVALSALIRPGGTTRRLRLAWQSQLFVPLVSRDTAAELIRVFAYPKFKLSRDGQHDLLADYLPWTNHPVAVARWTTSLSKQWQQLDPFQNLS